MSTQTKPSNVWLEASTTGGELPVPVYLQKDGSGDWILATSGAQDGVFVDWQGTGDYELVDLSDERFLVADGSDYTLDATGPAIAILADDGSGNPTISTTLTDTPIARFAPIISGDIVLYRDASPELQMLQVGSDVLCFQDD